MKRIDYFLDFQKLEELTDSSYWFDERDKSNFKYEFLKQRYLNKPAKKYKYPVMMYLGNKKFSIKYELEDIIEMIKNGATKAETEYYINHFKEHENNLIKQQFLNGLKSFTPCGIFYNRKSRVEIKQLNGIVMLEILSSNLLYQQIQIIKDEPYTYAFFRQLEKENYVIWVKTKFMTNKNYKNYLFQLKSYYSKLTKNNYIESSYINKIICLPNDKNVFWNNEHTCFYIL